MRNEWEKMIDKAAQRGARFPLTSLDRGNQCTFVATFSETWKSSSYETLPFLVNWCLFRWKMEGAKIPVGWGGALIRTRRCGPT
jgi:hypothetical protein